MHYKETGKACICTITMHNMIPTTIQYHAGVIALHI